MLSRLSPFFLGSLLAPLSLLLLANCASTGNHPAAATGLGLIQGSWVYSHAGSPSVWQEGLPDPAQIIDGNLSGTRVVIASDGSATLTSGTGERRKFRFQVAEETDLMLTLAGQDLDLQAGFEWFYDKTKSLLIMPLDLQLQQETGKIPAYFRRS